MNRIGDIPFLQHGAPENRYWGDGTGGQTMLILKVSGFLCI